MQLILWIAVAIIVAGLLGWFMARSIRWARKGTKGASMLAAAAFPFPDQPPPNEQVEHENRLRKDAESGGPDAATNAPPAQQHAPQVDRAASSAPERS